MDSEGNFPKRDKRVPYSGNGIQQEPKKQEPKKQEPKKQEPKKQEPKKQAPKKPSAKKLTARKRGGNKRSNRMKLRMIIWGILILIIVIGIYSATKKNGSEVFVGKQVVGILNESKTKAEDLTKTITAQLVAEVGSNVKLNEAITVKPIHVPRSRKKEVGTLDYLLPKIRKAVSYQVEASVIMVEGEKAAVLANAKESEEILAALKEDYPAESATLEITFVEKVEAVNLFVDSTEIISKEVALNKLQDTTEIKKTYTVVSGDTLGVISKKVEMSIEEIIKINEGLTVNTGLKIGQFLNILAKKPFVSVKTVETVVMTEVEPKKYVTQEDGTKNKGYQKVVQQGRDGQKESTKQIIRINGFEEEEKEISKKVTVEPIDEIIVQGTK